MEQHTPERKGPEQDGQLPDRYDNDQSDDRSMTSAEHDEYQARLERIWKHAAWRTEMARRLRTSGHSPSGPDSAF